MQAQVICYLNKEKTWICSLLFFFFLSTDARYAVLCLVSSLSQAHSLDILIQCYTAPLCEVAVA